MQQMSGELFKWLLLKRTKKASRDWEAHRGGTVKIWPRLMLKECDMMFQAKCVSFHTVWWYLLWHSAINLRNPSTKSFGKPWFIPTTKIYLYFSSSGLPLRCRWFSCPAVLSSRRRAFPGSVPRVAAGVQRPREPLRSQVQSQGLGPAGGAGPQSAGWDTLLHRVLGHVYQWSLPGWRQNLKALVHIYFFRLHKNFSVWKFVIFWGFWDRHPRWVLERSLSR